MPVCGLVRVLLSLVSQVVEGYCLIAFCLIFTISLIGATNSNACSFRPGANSDVHGEG
jgi:hypothetical protein